MNNSLPDLTMPYEPLVKKVGFAILGLILAFVVIGFVAGAPGDILLGGGMILVGCGISMLGMSGLLALQVLKQCKASTSDSSQQQPSTTVEASEHFSEAAVVEELQRQSPGSDQMKLLTTQQLHSTNKSIQTRLQKIHKQSDAIYLKYLALLFMFNRTTGSSGRDKFDKIIITNFKKNYGEQLQSQLTEIYADIVGLQSSQKDLYLQSAQLSYAEHLEDSLQHMEEKLDNAAEQCLLFQNEDIFLQKLILLQRSMRDVEVEESMEPLGSVLKESEIFQSLLAFRDAVRDYEHSFWRHHKASGAS